MDDTAFFEWALVEIMGHQKIAGKVSEITIAGHGMLRVDVPDGKGGVAFTRIYSPAAVYCISPVTEAIATRVAHSWMAPPLTRFDFPELDNGDATLT